LLEEFNIEIIQQLACSPEVNIWICIQSAVECMHWEQWRDADGLAMYRRHGNTYQTIHFAGYLREYPLYWLLLLIV